MQGGRPRVTAERVRVPRGPQDAAPHPVTPIKAPHGPPTRSPEPPSPVRTHSVLYNEILLLGIEHAGAVLTSALG